MSHKKTVLTLALGSALATSLGASATGSGENPFAAQPLTKGYMVAAADEKSPAKAAEGKCGDMKSDKPAAKSDKAKADEGRCGGMKKMDGKCGGMMRKMKDGACGDMKSEGDAKKSDAKAKDAACGASMKAGDGKCGADMKSDAKK